MIQIIIVFLIIIADQISKQWAVVQLKPMGTTNVIEGILSLTYVENRGAAFGILQNQRWFFIILTFAISAVIIYYLVVHRSDSLIFSISLALILGGAIGNLIDRIRFGYVVDMIHVRFINYPVFNIADCSVVIGTVLLTYYLLFISDKPQEINP